MGRSQESFQKKEVRNKKEKKRKEKEKKRLARKDNEPQSFEDMIAYTDENGNIVDTPPDPTKKTEIKLEDIEIGVPTRSDDDKYDPVRKGVVTNFIDAKGFGFIRDLETKESLFVHIKNCEDEIKEGNLVTFEVEMGLKGPAAMKVKLTK